MLIGAGCVLDTCVDLTSDLSGVEMLTTFFSLYLTTKKCENFHVEAAEAKT